MEVLVSLSRGREKTWYIQTVESGSARKRHEILAQATTWTDLENIMLSEISNMK